MAAQRSLLALFALQLLAKPCFSRLANIGHITNFYPEWKPNAIVDVGANIGKWSKAVRRVFPDAKFMLFEAFSNFDEPLKKLTEEMQNAQYKISVLSERDGKTVQFYQQDKYHMGNSYLKEQTDYFKYIQPVERNTTTLDTEIQESFLKDEPIDYLNIDAQGAELAVLKGATQVLKNVTFVEIETSLVEYNGGGASFGDIDVFMRQQGFYLYNLDDFVRDPKLFKTLGPGLFNALYVRPTSSRVPKYFTEVKPKYIGSVRSQQVANLSEREANEVQPTLQFSFWSISPLFFVVGILVGRMTRKMDINGYESPTSLTTYGV